MVRRKDIEQEILGYLKGLEAMGFPVHKAVLFGSMIKGNAHDYSDIDLAVWSPAFGDDYFETIEKTAPLKRSFKRIELHPFRMIDVVENNPFIREIISTGVEVSA